MMQHPVRFHEIVKKSHLNHFEHLAILLHLVLIYTWSSDLSHIKVAVQPLEEHM